MTDTSFALFTTDSSKSRLTWTVQSPSLRVPADMIQEYDDLVQRTQVQCQVKSEEEVIVEDGSMVLQVCKYFIRKSSFILISK